MKLVLIFLLFPLFAWSQTETIIVLDSLPETVKIELSQKYKKYTINLITKNIDRNLNVTYSVELQKKSKLVKVIYDKDGVFIRKEKSKSYTFDDSKPKKPKATNSGDGHNH